MTEAVFVNIATVVRVLLIGGALLFLPQVTRKGLLFGVYVGEAAMAEPAAQSLRRKWRIDCCWLILVSLASGVVLGATWSPIVGNYAATVVVLLGGLILYVRAHLTAQGLMLRTAARQAEVSVALIDGGEPRGLRFAATILGVCVVVSLLVMAYGVASLEVTAEGSSEDLRLSTTRAPLSILLLPSLNLILSPFLALIGMLTARAKLSIRGGNEGRSSAEAQVAFRTSMTYLLGWTSLFICAVLAMLSVQVIRWQLMEIDSLGVGVWWLTSAFLLITIGGLTWLFATHGQGGALKEEGGLTSVPLTNGLADNTHWYWGLFYFDRNDPSVMVEKRFGLGYTFNYGSWKAVTILAAFLLLVLGFTAFFIVALTP